MTKLDIIDHVSEVTECSPSVATQTVELIIETMKEILEGGEALKIAGFGNFSVRDKNARTGINPRTGDKITIDSRRVVTFKASPVLKEAVLKGA